MNESIMMNKTQPLVSCIMPTADRSDFVPTAIDIFLRQNYERKQLIIVDDGTQSIESLIPADPRIIYKRLTDKKNIGAKRNIACDMSCGEIIVHIDDDDWYANDWIDHQVEALIKSGADICGLSKLFFCNMDEGKAWKYVYPSRAKPWVAGATMAYRKSFWEKRIFRNIQVGEDNHFVWKRGTTVFCHDHIYGFISFLHKRNTSPKYTSTRYWRDCSISEIREQFPFLKNIEMSI